MAWTQQARVTDSWTTQSRISNSGGNEGWGDMAWGDAEWGSPTTGSSIWIAQTRVTNSWSKQMRTAILIAFLLIPSISFAGSTTTNYALYKPSVSEKNWGALVNTNFDTIDSTVKTVSDNTLKWDGGSSGLVAATGRTSLGLGTAALSASTDFLAVAGKAADSDLLDSHDTSYFQQALVSGTNIKTINSNSLLGSGDLVISGGTGTPGGSDTQIQYNSSGTFGGVDGLIYSGTSLSYASNLGVGTTTPSRRLHVQGQDNYPLRVTGSSGSNVYIGSYDGTYSGIWATPAQPSYAFLMTTTDTKIGASASGSIGFSLGNVSNGSISSAGLSIGTITSSAKVTVAGNLGINSTSPVSQLNIKNNSTTPFMITATTSGDRLIVTSAGNVGIGTSGPRAKLEIVGTGSTTGTAFQIDDNLYNPKLTVLDNGNVGIGSSLPQYLLDVNGTISATTIMVPNNVYARSFGSYNYSSADTNISTAGGYAINFKVNNVTVAKIDSSGNVGIGTTVPVYKLDVAGAGRFNEAGDVILAPGGYNVGIGTAVTSALLTINGTTKMLTIGTTTAGTITCFKADKSIGWCSGSLTGSICATCN